MKFEFIANACGIFHGSKNAKLLMDPWLDDGVFEGVGAIIHLLNLIIWISRMLIVFIFRIFIQIILMKDISATKDIPIFILKNKFNILYKKLVEKGYENLIELEDGQAFEFKEFNLTIFKPFVKNLYHEFVTGNLIDSALVIEDENGLKAFNSNDNTPDLNSCKKLKILLGILILL